MTDPDVRAAVRRAVHDIAERSGAAFTPRHVIRTDPDSATTREPGPLAGITAALAVSREADRLTLDYVRYAREDGLTWQVIGDAMHLADRPRLGESSAAVRAFYRCASDLGSGPVFPWTCPKCRQQVRDYGPEQGPREAEQGHAEGCVRFAATVAEWDEQWKGW